MVCGQPVRTDPEAARGRGAFFAARRPAVRQRRCAHRHGAEQDSQGFHSQVPNNARQTRAVRAGLGLPRVTDRVQGHATNAKGRQPRRHAGRHPQGVRGVRAWLHRHTTRAVQATRCARRVGQPVPHAKPSLRGGGTAAVRRLGREGIRLSRQEAGLLEYPVPHGVGRGGGGVSGPRQPKRVCEVPDRGRDQHAPVDLDHHAVDAPGQSRGRVQLTIRLPAHSRRGGGAACQRAAARHGRRKMRLGGGLRDSAHGAGGSTGGV